MPRWVDVECCDKRGEAGRLPTVIFDFTVEDQTEANDAAHIEHTARDDGVTRQEYGCELHFSPMKKPSVLSLVLGIGLAFGVLQSCWADGERKKLLGLPFGVPATLSVCSGDPLLVTSPCWLQTPQPSGFPDKVGGRVYLATDGSVPRWVDGSTVSAVMTSSGVIETVVVQTQHADREEISKSVSDRFGKPKSSSPVRDGGYVSEWRSTEGSASMLGKG